MSDMILRCAECDDSTTVKLDAIGDGSRSLEVARKAGWLPDPKRGGGVLCPKCSLKAKP